MFSNTLQSLVGAHFQQGGTLFAVGALLCITAGSILRL
jgi:hypothetical protein